jgi:hypothetical protein
MEGNPLWIKLRIADRFDTSNPSDKGKQYADNLKTIGLFGSNRRLNPSSYRDKRVSLYEKLNESLEGNEDDIQRLEIEWIDIVLSVFDDVLSETRHHATDLTLAGHSLATAIVFSLLAQSDNLYISRTRNTKANHNSLLNDPSKRIIGCDDNWIVIMIAGASESSDAIHFNQFDEVGESIGRMAPDIKPSAIDIQNKAHKQWVKKPSDIYEGYTKKKLIQDISRLTELAKLEKIQSIETRINGLRRHISNLEQALSLKKLNEEMEANLYEKRQILESMVDKIEKMGTFESILSRNKWEDSSHAYEWSWELLSRVMSPIRPTSPSGWARRILGERTKVSEEIVVRWILEKRLTLGRWFSSLLEHSRISGAKSQSLNMITQN